MASHSAYSSARLTKFSDPDGYLDVWATVTTNDGTWKAHVKSQGHLVLDSTNLARWITVQGWYEKGGNSSSTSSTITLKKDSSYTNTTKTIYDQDISSIEYYCRGKKGGDTSSFPAYMHYICKWDEIIRWVTSREDYVHYKPGWYFIVPYMAPGGGSFSGSPNGNVRKPASFTYTATWSGIDLKTQRNIKFYLQRSINGGSWTTIASTTGGSSGSLSASQYKAASTGDETWKYRLYYEYEGGNKTVDLGTKKLLEPLPAVPTMGSVNNTTATSINTNRVKTLSANWGITYSGWPHSSITYEYHCYSSNYGELASGTSTSTSHSFTWNMPAQDVRDNIYWKVRAKNSTGWSSYKQSGNVEVYWAYNEPAKITAGSVSPNRFQLFDGSTNIAFNANTIINGWGDRPGTRTVEYGLYRNGSSLIKWYGRLGTSSTGSFAQSLSASVPETDLNNTYHVIAHKRLGDTEYTVSSDPRYPTTGQNHVTAGTISFYEVIGRVEGTFALDPDIIISGLPNEISYSFTYDKQSSEKVDFFLEVYNITTSQVTKNVPIVSGVNVSKSYNGTISSTLVAPQQAAAYEIRYKATVTELLGNTHTYTLATLTPQCYNPPVGEVIIQNVSKPLPTYDATSLLAKQDTDITWNYSYSFQGVQINKTVLVIESQPYGREEVEVPFDPTTSPYYNNYTRISTGDFALGSKVSCKMIIYYQVIGGTRQYSVTTNTLIIDITPTRYLYYLARVGYGEQQLIKIHPLVGNNDKTSEKIHID